MKVNFIGTVVSCETRFDTKITRAFLTDFDANWVVTIDIESADDHAPAPAGTRASFLIHSPARALFVAADHAAGRRYQFEITREENTGQVSWSWLHGRELG